MIYKFKSKAAGDLIMLGPNGDAFLRVIGREPAAQGILEPADMDAALQAIERAIAQDEAQRRRAGPGAPPGVTPRQRLWPMVEMLRRAQAAAQVIVWGV